MSGGAAVADSAWRRLFQDVLRVNRSGVSLRNGLRMAVGTTIALAVGYAAGSWATGAAAAGGALAVGIASVLPAPRPRVALLCSTAVAMALGTFAGSATSGHTVPHLIVVAVFTFAGGLLVAVEPAVAPVGINTLVALLVYGRFPATPLGALETAGVVAAGGLFQAGLAVVARRRPQVGRALSGLARAYTALASYAGQLVAAPSSLPAAAAIDAATTDLEFSPGVVEEAWTSLAAEARRIRLELLSLATAREAAAGSEQPDAETLARFDRLASSSARFLGAVADGLSRAEAPAEVATALAEVESLLVEITERGHAVGPEVRYAAFTALRAVAAAHALGGQLRAVAALLPEAVSVPPALSAPDALRSATRVSRSGAQGAGAIVDRMRANLAWTSDAFQHAFRLTVVVTAASAGSRAAGYSHGYWITLTVVLILRPEFAVTFSRGVARAVGTLVGVGVASVVAVATHPHGWALVVLVGCFVWLSGAFFNASYAVFSIAVTGAVVFLLTGLESDPVATAKARLLATILGAALALGSYAAWPSWARRRAADAFADLADATRRYVSIVLRARLDGVSDSASAPAAGRAVRLARTNAESAVQRSLGDPSARRLDPRATGPMLAAFRRLAVATHTLRLPAVDSPLPQPAAHALRDLAQAIDGELGAVAAQLRFGRITKVREPLRAKHRALVDAVARESEHVLRADSAGAANLLVTETDEMVDATNSLRDAVQQLTEA
ncbi:MAG: hypothetical protein QOJ62_198 [Actinomycetota bacterium]|nr:hypothetical protein [Actinomycetota bacterium]